MTFTLDPFNALLLRLADQVVGLLGCDQLKALRCLPLDELAPAVQVDDPLQGPLVGLVVLELRVLQHKPPAVVVAQLEVHLLQVAGLLCGLEASETQGGNTLIQTVREASMDFKV